MSFSTGASTDGGLPPGDVLSELIARTTRGSALAIDAPMRSTKPSRDQMREGPVSARDVRSRYVDLAVETMRAMNGPRVRSTV